MARVYGRPFDRQAQLGRWIRRGTTGLAGGRSEAAAGVVLDQRATARSTAGPNGAPGAPGPDGTARITRGYRMFARLTAGGGPIATFPPSGMVVTGGSTSSGINNDLQFLPRDVRTTGSASIVTVGWVLNIPGLWVLGRGDGSGGFLSTFQFAILSLRPATGSWFVGIRSTTEPGYVLGAGQDPGDTAPFLMHTNAALAIVKTPTVFPSIVGPQICEVRMFSDPFTGGAAVSLETLAAGVSTGRSAAQFSDVVNPPLLSWRPELTVSNGATGGTSSDICVIGYYHEFQPVL